MLKLQNQLSPLLPEKRAFGSYTLYIFNLNSISPKPFPYLVGCTKLEENCEENCFSLAWVPLLLAEQIISLLVAFSLLNALNCVLSVLKLNI